MCMCMHVCVFVSVSVCKRTTWNSHFSPTSHRLLVFNTDLQVGFVLFSNLTKYGKYCQANISCSTNTHWTHWMNILWKQSLGHLTWHYTDYLFVYLGSHQRKDLMHVHDVNLSINYCFFFSLMFVCEFDLFSLGNASIPTSWK